VVFGEGDPEAGIILVGEAPGGVEDELGRPFVGPAGQLLDKILLAVGFRREQVYITNTVLCRPPGNRVPSSEEMAACRPWLDRRLAIMKPDIMVCLGASAARAVLGRDLRITRDRGRWQTLGRMKVMPTFHPAALLRDPSKKRAVWEDMKAVRAEWERLRAGGPPEREGRTA
jgi:DNA polymerase